MSRQIKSRKRVSEHGEVFTSEREVNKMLDLVHDQTLRPDSTFLEPACGDGNFLIEILKRKLEVINIYKKSQIDYEKWCFVCVSSLYGVDILIDNVIDSILKDKEISHYKDNRFISWGDDGIEHLWSKKELNSKYSDRQIRYIKECIGNNKMAYQLNWKHKEFPKL